MPVSNTPIGTTASTEKFSEWLLRDNNGNTKIDAIVTLLNQLEVNQGTLVSLNTTAKSDLVSAINELLAEFQTGTLIQATTGLLASLATTSKTNLVAAINELDAEHGVLSTLTTTAKGTLVAAINELDAAAGKVGDLTLLSTSDKTDLVSSINEVLAGLGSSILLSTTATDAVSAINELDTGQGDLSSLTTTIKTNLVGAINELIATAATTYIKVDGTSTVSANIPMNSKRITGLADGVDPQDAVVLSQVGTLTSAGNLALLNTTAQTDLVSAINEVIAETVAKTSSTGSAALPAGTTAQRDVIPVDGYLRFNSSTNKPEIYANSAWNEINYGSVTGSIYTDATMLGNGTVGTPFSIRPATTSVTGILEIATDAEAIAGSLSFNAIVPSSLKAALDAGGFVVTDATITGAGTTGSPFVVRPASETVTGIAERANATEAAAGADTTRFITPATLVARTATTSRTGLVELATGTETATGTDTTRAITPSGLLSRTATSSRKGVVELATNTEATTGTDTTRAVTPAGVAAAINALGSTPTVFNTSGTWTNPGSGMVLVMLIGGGGGGGYYQGGGGGGGGSSIGLFDASELPGSVSVTVGAGGAAGVTFGAAGTGGTSVFANVQASGGVGGIAQWSGGGAGGSSSSTSNILPSQNTSGGGGGTGAGSGNGGVGGASTNGGGGGAGGGGAASGGTSTYAGNGGNTNSPGIAPGGGGGGSTNVSAAGAAGAIGRVTVLVI